jgi:hypothetical protein
MMLRIRFGKHGVLLCVLSINLCAAVPPRDGVEVRGSAGAASYSYTSGAGGCYGPIYRNEADDMKAHARVGAYSERDHWSVVAEGSVSRSVVTSTSLIKSGETPEDPADIQAGRTRRAFTGVLRLGFHDRYAGAELGPGLYSSAITEPDGEKNETRVAFSGSIWAGDPELAYVWFSCFEGPSSASLMPISFGIGHASDWLRVTAGVAPLQLQLTGQVEFLLPFSQPIWVGGMVHGGSRDFPALGGMVTVAVPLDYTFR